MVCCLRLCVLIKPHKMQLLFLLEYCISRLLKCIICCSYYDPYRGVIVYFRVVDGTIRKGDKVHFMASEKVVLSFVSYIFLFKKTLKITCGVLKKFWMTPKHTIIFSNVLANMELLFVPLTLHLTQYTSFVKYTFLANILTRLGLYLYVYSFLIIMPIFLYCH